MIKEGFCHNIKCQKEATHVICGQIYADPGLTMLLGEITAFACEEHLDSLANEEHIASAIADGMSKTPEGYQIPDQTFTMVSVFLMEDFKKMKNKNLNRCSFQGCPNASINSVSILLSADPNLPPAQTSEIMRLCKEHSKINLKELVSKEQWEAMCLSIEASGKLRPKKRYSKLIFEPISNLN